MRGSLKRCPHLGGFPYERFHYHIAGNFRWGKILSNLVQWYCAKFPLILILPLTVELTKEAQWDLEALHYAVEKPSCSAAEPWARSLTSFLTPFALDLY